MTPESKGKTTSKTSAKQVAKKSAKRASRKVAKSTGKKTAKRAGKQVAKKIRKKATAKAAAGFDLKPLYRWYAREKRDLPFRRTTDFYPVWVSEIMLQQTRVAAMLPRYEEFMRRFPTVEALAASGEEDVLSAWRGLGYYSRARNLREGARQIVAEHDGRFPEDEKAARKIKGVGEYTAAAILSIAHGVELPVFDGNVRRVLSRLYHPGAPGDDAGLKELALNLIRGRGATVPGDHNQAMMELGAVICVPGIPDCPRCPLASACRGLAHAGGPAERTRLAAIPPGKKESRAVELEMRVIYIHEPETDLVWVVRDGGSRFFKKLWFFPVAYRVLKDSATAARKAKKTAAVPVEFPHTPGLELLNDPSAKLTVVRKRFQSGSFTHGITHHTIRGVIESFEVEDPRERFWKRLTAAAPPACEWRKVRADDLHERVVSSIARKILPVVRPEQPELF